MNDNSLDLTQKRFI